MSRAKKIAAGVVGVPAIGIVGLLGSSQFLHDKEWDAPLPEIQASSDPEVIKRGEYLVWGPGHCAGCHGAIERLPEYEESATRIPLSGGFTFPLPPGDIVAPNITPDEKTGIGKLSDQQIARALRHGVGHDGRMLFPVMPFQHVADSDLTAIISYVRTLEPVAQERPKTQLSLLGKVLYSFVVEPNGPKQPIPKDVTPGPNAEYGKYLAESVANCVGCHTDRDLGTGEPIGEPYAGGMKLPHNGKEYTIPNITPKGKGSRITEWDEAGFIARVRTAKPSAPGSPMPWAPLASCSDDDLKAIWAYLQTVKSVDNDTGPVLPTGE